MTEYSHASNPLTVALDAAVPLHILELREVAWDQRLAMAREAGSIIAEHGDNVLFKSTRKGETAAAFNAVARAIAILSYLPGGVTIFGRHWETPS